MISRRVALRRVAAFTAFGTTLIGSWAFAATDYELLRGLDRDRDGTLDLAEAKAAAARLFEMLDRDHDGRLSRHDLSGRLSVRELAAADQDHDRSLDEKEYLALVERRFKAADADQDGVLSAAELRAKPGRAVLLLLK
jgi:Ca2+-binding EF-hand superfamily protein